MTQPAIRENLGQQLSLRRLNNHLEMPTKGGVHLKELSLCTNVKSNENVMFQNTFIKNLKEIQKLN